MWCSLFETRCTFNYEEDVNTENGPVDISAWRSNTSARSVLHEKHTDIAVANPACRSWVTIEWTDLSFLLLVMYRSYSYDYELERCHGQRHRRDACDISVSLRTRIMQTMQWWLQPATAGCRWTEQRIYQWLYRVSIKSTQPLWLLLYQQGMSPVSSSWEDRSMPNMDIETSEDHHRRS